VWLLSAPGLSKSRALVIALGLQQFSSAPDGVTLRHRERMSTPTLICRTLHTPEGWWGLCTSEQGLRHLWWPAKTSEAAKVLWPAEASAGASQLLDAVASQIQEYLDGHRRHFEVPLDLSRMPQFRRQVLAACRQVPYGQCISYGHLARQIGRPRAARAVGRALARNPVPILIPCHRVVGSDGRLVGFGGGLKWKILLLRHEGITVCEEKILTSGLGTRTAFAGVAPAPRGEG